MEKTADEGEEPVIKKNTPQEKTDRINHKERQWRQRNSKINNLSRYLEIISQYAKNYEKKNHTKDGK